MLAFSCIAVAIVCVVGVSRRTKRGSQTHAPLWTPAADAQSEPESVASAK